jgi:hypothetical protein
MIPIQKIISTPRSKSSNISLTHEVKDRKHNIKLCNDCVYLQKDTLVCRKFVNMSLVTGEEFPILAIHARDNHSFCGNGALHFERPNTTDQTSSSNYAYNNECM